MEKLNFMKNLLFTISILISYTGYAQYSSYYGTVDVNVNSTVNKNINVTGNVNKTVTTIDYGALGQANAMNERNRIEGLKLSNQRDAAALEAIAQDPINSYNYGRDNTWIATKNRSKDFGFKKLTWYHKEPHPSLFAKLEGYSYQNISYENIKTLMRFAVIAHYNGLPKEQKAIAKERFNGVFSGLESYLKNKPKRTVGEVYSYGFLHKKELNKTTLYGIEGFKESIFFEDDYEIKIQDIYITIKEGVIYQCSAIYSVDKDEVTFEQLEGRRYYLRRTIDQFFSTARLYDYKVLNSR